MSETAHPGASNAAVFRRLLRMLRPHWGMIALGTFFLLIAAPCELFPAIAWKYITDDIALQKNTTPWMSRWFSFNGVITNRFGLLISATAWMFVVYLVGETFETLEGWVLNRVAQRFILGFR